MTTLAEKSFIHCAETVSSLLEQCEGTFIENSHVKFAIKKFNINLESELGQFCLNALVCYNILAEKYSHYTFDTKWNYASLHLYWYLYYSHKLVHIPFGPIGDSLLTTRQLPNGSCSFFILIPYVYSKQQKKWSFIELPIYNKVI